MVYLHIVCTKFVSIFNPSINMAATSRSTTKGSVKSRHCCFGISSFPKCHNVSELGSLEPLIPYKGTKSIYIKKNISK